LLAGNAADAETLFRQRGGKPLSVFESAGAVVGRGKAAKYQPLQERASVYRGEELDEDIEIVGFTRLPLDGPRVQIIAGTIGKRPSRYGAWELGADGARRIGATNGCR